MLDRAATWYPSHDAAVDESLRLTYAALHDAARRCAGLYHRLGVRKGDRVALLLYPSAVHCAAFFGAVELGALPVGLHTRESPQVLAAAIDRLAPRVLVFDAAVETAAAALRDLTSLVTGWIRAHSTMAPGPQALPVHATIPDDLSSLDPMRPLMPLWETDPAAIVLTSGSTGVPKGVVHTHRTLLESARGAHFYWGGIKPTDAIVNVLTTSFIGWHNLALPFLNVGAKCVFRARWHPGSFLDAVERERATHVFLAPTMWRMLLREGLDGRDLGSVRIGYFAGEMMDRTTLEQVRARVTPHVANVYGSTETGSCSAGAVLFEEDMAPDRLGSVGRPLLNADIRIIRPGGRAADEVPRGQRGEVIIRGPSVASLVWDDPETTARVFEGRDPWWHSGDEGYLDPAGFLYLTGRLDDMIISGGINIHPARVEEALLSHAGVAECAVIGVPDPEWGQRVKAYVVAKRPDLGADDLDRFLLSSALSNYQRPRTYAFVEELPKTSTGKIDRRALRESEARSSRSV
jgi:fatty-acyl-CoA synthase